MLDFRVEFPLESVFLVVAAISLVVLVLLVRRSRLLAATLTAAITTISTAAYLLEPESPRMTSPDTTDPPKKKRPVIVLDINRIKGSTRRGSVDTKDSNPREFVTVGSQVLFTAVQGGSTEEGDETSTDVSHRIYRYFQESLGVYTAEPIEGWQDAERSPMHLTRHGEDLYFAATKTGESQLWHMTSAYAFAQVGAEAEGDVLGEIHGILSVGDDVMVCATLQGGNELALWKITSAGEYAKVADTPLTATDTVHFLDCGHASGGFLAMAVGSDVGDFEIHCRTDSSTKDLLYHDVTEVAAFGSALFLAGREDASGDRALLYVDMTADGAVSGAGGNPGTLFAGTDWLYFSADSGGGRIPRLARSMSTVADVEVGGSVPDIYAFTATDLGTVWFAAESSAGASLWEIEPPASEDAEGKATEITELTGAGPIADLAATTTRIVALTTNADYFWYHDSTETVNELPKDLAGAEPAGPLHTWGERVLFAAEHSTYGLEPYHFPELSE